MSKIIQGRPMATAALLLMALTVAASACALPMSGTGLRGILKFATDATAGQSIAGAQNTGTQNTGTRNTGTQNAGTRNTGPRNTADERPIIACFGDSLTAGYGVDVDSSYPADLQRDLDAAGYHYRVLNLGISGETTKDGLARVERVIAMKPAVVVVEFGGNDGLRGIPISNSRANLEAILAKLTHSGTRVAVAGVTLPPQYGGPYIREFNATYTLLATRFKVPLLPFVLQDVYGVPGSIQQDGIHPTAQGCKQVAKNIYTLIKPLLKK